MGILKYFLSVLLVNVFIFCNSKNKNSIPINIQVIDIFSRSEAMQKNIKIPPDFYEEDSLKSFLKLKVDNLTSVPIYILLDSIKNDTFLAAVPSHILYKSLINKKQSTNAIIDCFRCKKIKLIDPHQSIEVFSHVSNLSLIKKDIILSFRYEVDIAEEFFRSFELELKKNIDF